MADPIMTLKPKGYVPVLGAFLGRIVLVSAFLIMIAYVLPEYLKYALDVQVLGIIACLLLLMASWQYLSTRRTEYKVYSDRVEYQESFFTQTTTSIPQQKVDSVTLHRGWFGDRIFSTGSITFITQEKSLTVDYLENSQETYEKLLQWQNKTTAQSNTTQAADTKSDLASIPVPDPKE